MSRAFASARCVGICSPRTSRPVAMSAANASTMRRKTGPCHSDNVGTQSMQSAILYLIVWASLLIAGVSRRQGVVMMNPEQGSTAKALWWGFAMRCWNCCTGKSFGRFLKVVHRCSVCGEELSHHRADDFPAYVVILVVGHTMVPAALAVDMNYGLPLWLNFLIWLPLMVASALALLQPTKGAIVGLQWQLGMHRS